MSDTERKIPTNVKNPKIYIEARKIADETYERPSAYKSMFMVRKYKELGGDYKDKKTTDKKDLSKKTKDWRDEEWIQIKPYIIENKKIKCGEGENTKACRPLKNVKGGDDNMTMKEIVKKYGKKKVLELTNKKMKDMDGYLDWKNGAFTPAKDRQREKK
tara:strand:- start:5058 stop:5534 length:477 start_codon:yes stop_codon:yes gene_type:complete